MILNQSHNKGSSNAFFPAQAKSRQNTGSPNLHVHLCYLKPNSLERLMHTHTCIQTHMYAHTRKSRAEKKVKTVLWQIPLRNMQSKLTVNEPRVSKISSLFSSFLWNNFVQIFLKLRHEILIILKSVIRKTLFYTSNTLPGFSLICVAHYYLFQLVGNLLSKCTKVEFTMGLRIVTMAYATNCYHESHHFTIFMASGKAVVNFSL